MGYEVSHASSKYSGVSDLLLILSQLSWTEVAVYLIVFNIFAYLLRKKLGKKT